MDLRRGKASFLCVGNWMRRKGIHDLLEAFARLPEDSGSLHLAGDTDIEPAYASRLRQRLAQADLAGRVVVHGVLPLAEISRLYAAADVFVLPSYREPYGTVYGEAMAMGLPVVGWRAGNLPFLAEDGREGVLLPPGDVPGLASALLALAQDERWRQRLGAAALARALRRPTWRETAGLFFGALREVVAEAHEPVPGRGSSRPAQAPGDS